MNRTIISIEVQDHGGKDANIIVRGEGNNQTMFEEQFDYKDEEKHSLRLHLLKGRFMEKFPKLGDSLGILCIRKLFNDITIRSKMKANPDYRDKRIIKKINTTTWIQWNSKFLQRGICRERRRTTWMNMLLNFFNILTVLHLVFLLITRLMGIR